MSGYNTKVYHAQGGDEFVVASGGKIIVEAGGTIQIDGTGDLTAVTFDSAYFTVSDGEVTLKAEVASLLEIIDGIPTIDPEQAGEVWLDGSKLKVSSGD